MARIGIIYYSPHGSTRDVAAMLAEGISRAGGEAHLRRVAGPPSVEEHPSDDVGAIDGPGGVPEATIEELPEFDGFLIGSSANQESDGSPLQCFLERTSPLWTDGRLVGKPVGFFTGAVTADDSQEASVLAMSTFAYHHGMLIVPVRYGSLPQSGAPPIVASGSYGATHLMPISEHGDLADDRQREMAFEYAAQVNLVADRLAAVA